MPNFYWIWIIRANVLEALGHREAALTAFDQALQLKPDAVSAWIGRVRILLSMSCYEEMIGSCNQALHLQPDCEEAMILRTIAWHWQSVSLSSPLQTPEEYEIALAFHNQVIQVNPDDALIWCNRGIVLRWLKRYEEAIASHDRAIELKPDDASFWGSKGRLLEECQRYKEALSAFDRAVQILPNNAGSWDSRGDVLEKLQRHEEAIASYQRAIQIPILRRSYRAYAQNNVFDDRVLHIQDAGDWRLRTSDRCLRPSPSNPARYC